ncbi:hypothetical protein GCM10008932_05640 [Alkalibacterium iburiense]|uniref:Type VII secretion system protein EssD-like domain-containing protein n=1 Tax=Alkalibacterium iburiense TaxID=290589 RepID=A0ABP3GV24_9LACT
MMKYFKWFGYFIGFIIAFSLFVYISPITLLISLLSLWYFSKKKPNEKFKKFAKNGAMASIIGLVFFVIVWNSETDEIELVSDQATEQVVVADENVEEEFEIESEEAESDDEEKRLAEEQRQREKYQKLQEQKKEDEKERQLRKEQQKQEQEEREKQEELERKEKEEREKELAEANPNKSGDTTAPNKPTAVPQGKEDVQVNNNVPFFSNEDITSTDVYHRNGSLDSLGRETAANAVVGVDIMPAEQRGSTGHIEPSGWNQARYANIGSGGWLFNRSHLIGHQMTGNDDRANLMTGTRWFNMRMLEYENWVANYVETTENHVRYRVTPVFEGNNLVASGAYMEAFSIEDNGEGVMFNIYVPNVQPGVEINYADGSSIGPAGPAEDGEISSYNGGNSNSSNSNSSSGSSSSQESSTPSTPSTTPTPDSSNPYVDENGNGLIKGSSGGIYHVPGGSYYDRTTNPVEMFKSIEEAESAGYRAPKR